MQNFVKIPIWLMCAASLTILTIVAHEVAHFLAAKAAGAENVSLHWADVTFLDGSVGNMGVAFIWLAGPAVTHAIIIWVLLSKAHSLAAMALGIGACSRNIVVLPFTIKFLLGRDTSTFTNDEVTAAAALDVSPMFFALPAVLFGLVGGTVFIMRACKTIHYSQVVSLICGVVLGIVCWGAVGPILLPGGKGFG